jgi:hypothetical protein
MKASPLDRFDVAPTDSLCHVVWGRMVMDDFKFVSGAMQGSSFSDEPRVG